MTQNYIKPVERLKLLHVVASPFPANQGTAAATCELISALSSRGHEIHVVTYYQGLDLDLPGITIHRIPRLGEPGKMFVGFNFRRPFLDFLLIFKTLQTAIKIKPDVIHCHHHEGIYVSYLTKLLSGTPTLYHCHASMAQELPLYLKPKSLFRRLGQFLDFTAPKIADYNIAVSQDLANEVKKVSSVCSYMPLIVDHKIFANPNEFHPLEKLNINGKKIVLYTGVIDQFQGIENLLKSMKLVKNKVPGSVLIIATPLSNSEQVTLQKSIADKLGISDSVFYIENLPFKQLPSLIAAADVTVIPRMHCPGFPIKLLNYIASNKPVVAMKGSGKVLENEVNGLIAENYEDFGVKIVKILENPALGNSYAKNAKPILENFSPESVSKKMEKIYSDLINKN